MKTNIRFVKVKEARYLRADDVADFIRELAGSEEMDVRTRLNEAARNLMAHSVKETVTKEWRPKLGDAVAYLDGYSNTWKRGEVWSYTGEDRVYVNRPDGTRGEYRLHELQKPAI